MQKKSRSSIIVRSSTPWITSNSLSTGFKIASSTLEAVLLRLKLHYKTKKCWSSINKYQAKLVMKFFAPLCLFSVGRAKEFDTRFRSHGTCRVSGYEFFSSSCLVFKNFGYLAKKDIECATLSGFILTWDTDRKRNAQHTDRRSMRRSTCTCVLCTLKISCFWMSDFVKH